MICPIGSWNYNTSNVPWEGGKVHWRQKRSLSPVTETIEFWHAPARDYSVFTNDQLQKVQARHARTTTKEAPL